MHSDQTRPGTSPRGQRRRAFSAVVTLALVLGGLGAAQVGVASPAQAGTLKSCTTFSPDQAPVDLSVGASASAPGVGVSLGTTKKLYPIKLCSRIEVTGTTIRSVGYELAPGNNAFAGATLCGFWVDVDVFERNVPGVGPYHHSQGSVVTFPGHQPADCFNSMDLWRSHSYVGRRTGDLPKALEPGSGQCTTIYSRPLANTGTIAIVARNCSVIS